jgi:hypothetical protein
MRSVALLVSLAACSSTPNPPPVTTENDAPADASATPERRAVVRIDAQPGGKKFQGVWLELADGQRWVVDYRPREVWRGFEGAEVLFSGHCYRPFGQAISATHFEVERMRFAAPGRGHGPLVEIGAEETLKGALELEGYPPGSKRAGSQDWHFRVDGGDRFRVWGGIDGDVASGPVVVKARRVEIDPTWAATPTGAHLWIGRVYDAGYTEDPRHADVPKPCPGD